MHPARSRTAVAVLLLVGAGLAAGLVARAATEAPPAAPAASPGATPAASPSPTPELPRIVRTVCTDHICGGCDGKCSRNGGHVAVDKRGHCACTPTEGSPLDRATRQAYEKKQPQ